MKIIGHRGARGLAPENTIASLKKALEHHVDEIEFDLRVTKDGIVILHHNRTMSDRSGQKMRIKQHTYAELLEHKPDLPTFEQVLSQVGNKTPLHVEIKFGEKLTPIVKIIKAQLVAGWKPSDFLLGSKSQKILVELHKAFPEIQKVVIEPWSGIRATYRAGRLNTKRLSMNQLFLWRGFISPMSKRGWELSAYALNDTAKARRWEKHGLYGVITDYPDRFEKK